MENVKQLKNKQIEGVNSIQQSLKERKQRHHEWRNRRMVKNALRIRKILESIQGAKIIRIKDKIMDGKNEK